MSSYSSYSGVVSKIFPKASWGAQSFGLQSVDRTYFNLGKVPPMFSEGQTISFEGSPGKRPGTVEVNVNSIVVETETPVKAEDYKMANGARRGTEVLTKDKYWENREANDKLTQKRIEIQAARNAAIAVIATGFVSGGTTDLDKMIAEWTDKFLADNEKRLNV